MPSDWIGLVGLLSKSRKDEKMKRAGYIWEKFCTVENATKAIYRGTENKRKDRVVVRLFGSGSASHTGELDPDKVRRYAEKLVECLESGNWHHQEGLKKPIVSGGKAREIEIAKLQDHFIQWMAILAIEDLLLKKMYRYSCGNVPGRGIEYARKTVEKWARSGDCKYFVKLDIRHFYQNIDAARLASIIHGMIKDKRFLSVIDEIIYSTAVPAEDGTMRGLAIGYYSSPWLANTYLNSLDRFITSDLYKERRGKRVHYVKHYLRNVDDLLLMGNSKSDLKKAVKQVIVFCKENLGLEIKPAWEICAIGTMTTDGNGKQIVAPGTKKIDIVGYTFTTTTTTVRDYNFLRCRRLAKTIAKRLEERNVVFLRNARALESRCGWFSHADSAYFFKNYIDPYIDRNFIKEVISYADKNGIIGDAARVYCRQRGDEGGYYILYGCC